MIWFWTGPFLYLAAAVFVAGATWKVVGLARLPRHLRWELYPIPHLGPEGSKYQKVDFAALPRRSARLREIVFTAQEILLLKKVFAARRDLWLGSWLLHAGLYLGIVFLGLLGAGAIPALLESSASAVPRLLPRATGAMGVCSLVSGLAGTVYLLCLRLADRGLRDMSDRITFFNLILLAALFGSGLLAWGTGPAFVQAQSHLVSLLRGRPAAVESSALASALVLTGLFVAYLPFSRMFHAAAKYFFYHAILWDEEPMRRGGRMEQDIAACLDGRVTWSAAHVRQNESWRGQIGGAEDTKGATHGP